MPELLPPRAAYLGQVATRCYVPYGNLAPATAVWLMSRSMHWAKANIVNPTVVFANFKKTSGNVETTYGAGTIKAAIEYPAGTFTLANECIAAGNGPVAFPIGLAALTFNVSIPWYARFWVRSLQQNSNQIIFSSLATNSCDPTEGMEIGTGAVSDKVMTGTVSQSFNRSQGYWPIAILAQTRRPSFLLVGDSRGSGYSGDGAVTDASGDVGQLARLVGRSYSYINIAIGSSLLATYLSQSRTYTDQLTSFVSNIINAHGVNDIQSGGDSAATLAGRRATLAATAGYAGKVIGTTLTPNTSSSDNFATIANQTVGTNGTKVMDFNTLARAGIAGEIGLLDISDMVDPLRLGKWHVSRNPFEVTGTANFGTPDGLHESSNSNEIIRDRGAALLAGLVQ